MAFSAAKICSCYEMFAVDDQDEEGNLIFRMNFTFNAVGVIREADFGKWAKVIAVFA